MIHLIDQSSLLAVDQLFRKVDSRYKPGSVRWQYESVKVVFRYWYELDRWRFGGHRVTTCCWTQRGYQTSLMKAYAENDCRASLFRSTGESPEWECHLDFGSFGVRGCPQKTVKEAMVTVYQAARDYNQPPICGLGKGLVKRGWLS